MFRTLAIIAGVGFVIAALCFGGAAALAGPDIAKSSFWRDFHWEHFEPGEDEADIDPNAPTITQARDVTGFTSVSVGGGLRTEITVGPAFAVEVISPEPQRIATDVLGTELTIEPVRNRSWWRSHRRALVRVSMPAIEGVDSSAGADVRVAGVAADALKLEASSGSEINVVGTCRTLNSEASSGASIDADTLTCESGSAHVSSGAEIEINVTGRLDVEASSGGSVETHGSPQIGNISLSSGGSLDRN